MLQLFLLISGSIISLHSAASPYEGGLQMADASSIWRLFFALAFLIVLIPLVIFGLKRLQGLQHKFSKSEIQIIASQSIGTKERLLLIEVQGKRLLIGATSNSITCLREFDNRGDQFAELMSEQLSDDK